MELLNEKEKKELTEKYPLYSQEGKKGEAIILYHFFLSGCHWYVMEGSKEGDDITLFGIASISNIEFGYFSLSELENTKIPLTMGTGFTCISEVERDSKFKPISLRKLKNKEVIAYLNGIGYFDE